MKGGQDALGPEAFGACGALACTHFSMVRVKCSPLLVAVSNIFFQEDAAVVTHTNPISLPRHPGLPLLSMLNGISPPVRLGNLYHGGQIC